MKTFIAIDPGASGGLAWTTTDIHSVVTASTPDTESDYVDLLKDIYEASKVEGDHLTAYVEKVSGFTKAGGHQPGSAMFKFGFGCGVIEGALRALGIPTIYVTPQKWQKHFSLGTASKCGTKTIWKNKLRAEAQRRYPDVKVTLAVADALLMLTYAQAQENQ